MSEEIAFLACRHFMTFRRFFKSHTFPRSDPEVSGSGLGPFPTYYRPSARYFGSESQNKYFNKDTTNLYTNPSLLSPDWGLWYVDISLVSYAVIGVVRVPTFADLGE